MIAPGVTSPDSRNLPSPEVGAQGLFAVVVESLVLPPTGSPCHADVNEVRIVKETVPRPS